MTRVVDHRSLAFGTAFVTMLSLTTCQEAPGSRDVPVAGRDAVPMARAVMVGGPKSDPEPPEILVYRDVAPETAVTLNAQMPVSSLPIISARPFRLGDGASQQARAAATDCMTAALFYEAASEGDSGQRAVAQVVLNRLRHPAFPKSVCGVVFQGADRATGCQFTFTCDGSLARRPSQAGWNRARRIAEQALSGKVDAEVGLATHYHTQRVVPYWRSDLTKLALVGAHIFYRWQGGWGGPSAFSGRYEAGEALPPKLAASLPVNYLLSTAPGPEASADISLAAASGRLSADEAPRLPSLPRSMALVADEQATRPAADEQRGQLLLN